jgi:hypothetical protein
MTTSSTTAGPSAGQHKPIKPISIKEWDNVSQAQLLEEIIPAYQPAVIKNAMKDWPLLDEISQSPSNLLKYRGTNTQNMPQIGLFIADAKIKGRFAYGSSVNSRNFKQVSTDLESVMAHLDGNSSRSPQDISAYAGAVDMRQQLPLFEDKNRFPLLAHTSKAVPRAWIGTPSQISAHFDFADNIACVVSGEREFTLIPPSQTKNMYVAPFDKTLAGPPASLVNIDEPDLEKHPRYGEALSFAQTATLNAGDAIYIPSLWWHSVKSSGQFCMLINYWWNQAEFRKDDVLMSLIHGMYSLSHLPEAERKAWKELFDYFVFQSNEEALSHLPNEQRGVHAKMDAQLQQHMLSYLMRQKLM